MSHRAAQALARPLLILSVGAATVHAFVAWAILSVIARGDGIGDWVAFYSGATMLREGNAGELYNTAAQLAAQRALFGPDAVLNVFVLPSFVAAALSPLTFLSFQQSYVAWLAINVLVGAALVFLAARSMRDPDGGTHAVFAALAATSFPVVNLVLLGQVDLFVVAGLAGGFVLARRGHPFLAGGALGLALVKPHFVAPALLMLVLQRQWRAAGAFAVVAAVLLGGPAMVFGFDQFTGQVALLARGSSAAGDGRVNAEMMANARGFVASVFGVSAVWAWAPAWLAIAIPSTAVAVRTWVRATPLDDRSCAIACMLPVLVSPHVHAHSLVLVWAAMAFHLRGRRLGDPATIAAPTLLYCATTALWVVSVLGVSLLGVLVVVTGVLMARGDRLGVPGSRAAADPRSELPQPSPRAA